MIDRTIDPRSIPLSELSARPIEDWIALKSAFPERYNELIYYAEHPGSGDPGHEAWKAEQTDEARNEREAVEGFWSAFDDYANATQKKGTRNYA